MGDCAAVRVGGGDVVLIANRTQATGLELFTNLGIDPTEKKIVVVKSTNHFMAAYGSDRQEGRLCRIERTVASQSQKSPVHQGRTPDLALDQDAKPRGLIY